MSSSFSRAGLGLVVCSLLAAIVACGGSAAPATAPGDEATPADGSSPAKAEGAEESSTETPAQSNAEVAKFEDMKPGEKMDYMKSVVLPKMTSVFQESGDDEFKQVTCKTCHGSRAAKGNFKMPNEDILPLDAKDHMADEMKAHPEMMKFMGSRVVPEMAKLLGEEPYNMETHQGFGCFGCHTMQK